MNFYKKATSLLLIFSMITGFAGCATFQKHSQDKEAELSSSRYLESMDTVMKLTAFGSERDTALNEAVGEIQRLDLLLNAEDPNSDVSILNRTGSCSVSPVTAFLVKKSVDLFYLTDGAFDITVYPLTRLWGFPTKEYRVPQQNELQNALSFIGSERVLCDESANTVSLDAGQAIDLGGIAKGYTSQHVIDIFKENGIRSGIVSLGGNIQCLGSKPDGSPWNIGIQDPWNSEGDILAVIKVVDKAVITSGGYERFFVDDDTGITYRHILDPKTGYPVESGLASVTIITSDGVLGDGASTALYIMGYDRAVEFWKSHSDEFDAVLVDDDGNMYATEGLKEIISSDKPITFIMK